MSEGLMWWEDAGADPMAALALVMAHPALRQAVRVLAGNMLDLEARDATLAGLFRDAGRYVAAMCALYLHRTGGLTLPRLKEVCTRTGLLGPGRARALLQHLEHVGYVARAPGADAAVRYVPTAAFLAAWTAQLRAALEAGRVMEPEIARLLDEPGDTTIETFGQLHTEGLLTSVSNGEDVPAFLRVFMHPLAGIQIVWTLIMDARDQAFPPGEIGPISISALSKRFGVSRIHLSRMFAEAEREGLASLDGDGMVRFHPPAQAQVHFLYAAQLLQILSAGAKTAQAHGLVGPRTTATA